MVSRRFLWAASSARLGDLGLALGVKPSSATLASLTSCVTEIEAVALGADLLGGFKCTGTAHRLRRSPQRRVELVGIERAKALLDRVAHERAPACACILGARIDQLARKLGPTAPGTPIALAKAGVDASPTGCLALVRSERVGGPIETPPFRA